MMKIVRFRRWKEGQMIAAVRDESAGVCYQKPQHDDAKVRCHYQRTDVRRKEIGNHVLDWMIIERHNADRGCPLVVDFMRMFVEAGMMR